MKRLMLLAVLAAALILAACGGDDNETTAAPADDGGAFPVTIQSQFGEATIPEAPERVVTVGFGEDDYAYALGVTPVAIRTFLGDFDAAQRPWKPEGDTPTEVGSDQINFEQVAAARPDVILGVYAFLDEATYKKLSQIAPVVAPPQGAPEGGVPWEQQLRIDAEALGKSAEAEELIDEVTGQFETAAEDNPDFAGKTIAVTLALPDGPYILEPEDPRARFFTELGFENAPKTGAVSEENVDLIDQDVVVVLGDRSVLERNPAFGRLDAVREDRVVDLPLDGDAAGALGFSSPLSLPVALEEIVPQLAQAVGNGG